MTDLDFALLRFAQTCEAEALRLRKVMDTVADRLADLEAVDKDHEHDELIAKLEVFVAAGHAAAAQFTVIGLKARGQAHYVI